MHDVKMISEYQAFNALCELLSAFTAAYPLALEEHQVGLLDPYGSNYKFLKKCIQAFATVLVHLDWKTPQIKQHVEELKCLLRSTPSLDARILCIWFSPEFSLCEPLPFASIDDAYDTMAQLLWWWPLCTIGTCLLDFLEQYENVYLEFINDYAFTIVPFYDALEDFEA